jgi:hypothetical protein
MKKNKIKKNNISWYYLMAFTPQGGGEKEGHKIISFFQKISNGDVFFPSIFETYHDDVDEKKKKKGKPIFFPFSIYNNLEAFADVPKSSQSGLSCYIPHFFFVQNPKPKNQNPKTKKEMYTCCNIM